MDISDEVRRTLQEIGFHEVRLTTNFVCYRKTEGGVQRVLVEISDMGSGPARYKCIAKTEDDEYVTTGNSDSSPGAAIREVHWHDLLRKTGNSRARQPRAEKV
jgi:hypothetical protein